VFRACVAVPFGARATAPRNNRHACLAHMRPRTSSLEPSRSTFHIITPSFRFRLAPRRTLSLTTSFRRFFEYLSLQINVRGRDPCDHSACKKQTHTHCCTAAVCHHHCCNTLAEMPRETQQPNPTHSIDCLHVASLHVLTPPGSLSDHYTIIYLKYTSTYVFYKNSDSC